MNDLYKLLLGSMFFHGSDYDTIEDIIYSIENDKIMEIRLSLTMEIIELYEELGYSYDEIVDMIEKVNFVDDNLTDDEKEYLKRDAKKVLNIRRKINKKKENDKYE